MNDAIDEVYEFSAPKFYDFVNGETELDIKNAQLWFHCNSSYAPSPFMTTIKATRTVEIETLCDFSEAEELEKATDQPEPTIIANNTTELVGKPENETNATGSLGKQENETNATGSLGNPENETRAQVDPLPSESKMGPGITKMEQTIIQMEKEDVSQEKVQSVEGLSRYVESTSDPKMEKTNMKGKDDIGGSLSRTNLGSNEKIQSVEVPLMNPTKGGRQTASKQQPNYKKIPSLLRNPSRLKTKPQSEESKAQNSKPTSLKRNKNVNDTSSATNFSQENQAIKRQKLEGGNARQVLIIKPSNLQHKTRPGVVSSTNKADSSTIKAAKEDRKLYIREPSRQFVSAAEMVKKFQSSTRDISLPHIRHMTNSVQHDAVAGSLRKPKLKLTRPKEPEFETSQRARPTRIKSSTESEEEMMAKMPKFKARPVNKKILEAASLQAPQRTAPQLPEFKEFHLETMSRANQNVETSCVVSTESVAQSRQWNPQHLTAPKLPVLHTSLRARSQTVKSSEELEKEELEKLPKFKAKPLNKKIFENKGGLGIFCNLKRQITVPEEFHFALDKRVPPPPTNVSDLFDKLSLNLEPRHCRDVPKVTNPNPFNLLTEERGVEKERRQAMEILKQQERERARVPKAIPCPYTTDFPVIPLKPEPKPCTKPEPFQLESLIRHEEEMQREMEERQRMEMEEAQKRIFRAQPILKEDPIPLPEKERRPLTQVQEFELHVGHRAVNRSEFDKKIKEKEIMYKRYQEEAESARMMEEEKSLRQLRRMMVPHARPVPKFHQPFLPQRSNKEITKPKSPKLHILRRRERRKMYSPLAAPSSSSASNMR